MKLQTVQRAINYIRELKPDQKEGAIYEFADLIIEAIDKNGTFIENNNEEISKELMRILL